ncbi:UvrD-helicase domain-containing protein [Candidatus Uhrbacteria bacterium]|nr:UvrD-helicase domain-containing protein [Candidatus Uhrbacteria bacterium]
MSEFILSGGGRSAGRKIEYLAELNQEQIEPVMQGDGPCLVLAGAGSGKTRVVTYRVAYLLEQGVDPASILLLTFTNKAAREMLQRVALLIGQEERGIWGGTFHSTANRILRSYASSLGYSPSFTILDQEDAASLIKAVMKEMKIDPKARRFPTAAVVQNVLSFCRNTLTQVEDALEFKHPNFVPFAGEVKEIGEEYTRRKKAANAMDFDDLLANWLALVDDPDIGRRLAAQFKYILVDEYQDTNAIQAALVHGLAHSHRNVMVVGDDAQSIYAFRGADVRNILSFPTEWPGCKIFKLLTNYRSAPEILDLANESLAHNAGQFQKDLVAVRDKGRKPIMVSAASARQEAQFVAEQVFELRSKGTALGNMAVLFRSSAHSQALEFELMRRDVPYEYRGGMKFFERAHIKDALAYVRVAHNPQDEAAWLRVLNLQTGIGATTASKIISKVKGADDLKKILDADVAGLLSTKAAIGWNDFEQVEREVLQHAPTPSLMLKAVLDSSYHDYLEREYPDWRDRLEDVEQLVLFAENYHDATTFLSDIALYDEVVAGREKSGKRDDERLILSTIHQAKGLEWDTVFIIHLADSAFPNRRAMSEEGGLEEERRLFYVAVTRARSRLFLAYPLTSGFDTLTLNQPSLFIEELSPRLLEFMELREAGNYGRSQMSNAKSHDGWSWDDGYDEPAIEIGGDGNFKPGGSQTVWKSNLTNDKPKPKSFLRDVDEL